MMFPALFERDFDDFDELFKVPAFHIPTKDFALRTDVKDTDNAYELHMDVPGIAKDNIKIELDGGYLTVSVEVKDEKDEKDEKGKKDHYIRRERYYGSSSRSFYVGDAVKAEDISAKFENGVLQITVPKKELEKIETKQNIAIQ